jgi:FkbM family methyltransferase
LRNKQQSLDLLNEYGFTPELIVDVGAAAGTEGLYTTWQGAHYVLIDILPTFEAAMRDIAATMHSAEVVVAAVGCAPDRLEFARHPTHPHSVALSANAPADWIRFSVDQLTLDSIVENSATGWNFQHAIVKIDVDGPELDVLKGSAQLLNKNCVFIIETPLCDATYSRFTSIAAYMRESGYEMFDLIEPVYRPSDRALWQVDTVYVPRNSVYRCKRTYN